MHFRRFHTLRQHGGLILLLPVGAALALVLSAPAIGQQADPKPPAKEAAAGSQPAETAAPVATFAEMAVDDKLSRLGKYTIPTMLRDGIFTATFDEYFCNYFFPRMTHLEDINKISNLREELDSLFSKAARNQSSIERLNLVTYEMMYAIVIGPYRAVVPGTNQSAIVYRREDEKGGNQRLFTLDHKAVSAGSVKLEKPAGLRDFHPAVKYNAMLIIGQLNDQPANNKDPAVPRVKSLLPLLRIAGHPNAPESLRVAALIGVQRHAQVKDLEEGIKARIAGSMVQILDEKPACHAWIRRMAVDVIAALGTPGAQNAYVDKLAKTLADRNNPLSLRTAAAEALGNIKLSERPASGVQTIADNCARLALDAATYELDDSGAGAEKFSASRLAGELKSINIGLMGAEPDKGKSSGLSAVADDKAKPFVEGLYRRIAGIIAKMEIDPATSSNSEIKKSLQITTDDLAAFLQARGKDGSLPATGAGRPTGGSPIDFPD